MAYTDESKIEKYLTVDIDSSFSAQVTEWIAAVKTWIDRYTGKTFEAASADRYYDGCGGTELLVDSFIGSPTVVILNSDGTTSETLTEGASDDYLTYPLNTTEKNKIVLLNQNFPRGNRRVKITASWGFSSSVPGDISVIATKLVGKILEKGIDGGKLSQTQLGDAQVSFEAIDEAAEALGIYQTLDMYRNISI